MVDRDNDQPDGDANETGGGDGSDAVMPGMDPTAAAVAEPTDAEQEPLEPAAQSGSLLEPLEPEAPAVAPQALLEEIANQSGQAPLLDQILAECSVGEDDPAYEQLRQGVVAICRYVVKGGVDPDLLDRPLVDLIISSILGKVARQVDVILHHPTFQALEASWRELKFLIDRVDFRENIQLLMLNVSKMDLLEDFQDSPEIPVSGLFRIVYSAEYGVFGGQPYGLLIGNYEFKPVPQDIYLMDQCAAVATMAHAPFVAAASPAFFGLDSWHRLPNLGEVRALFEGPQYTKWRAFRDTDDSRYFSLCLPRFLLRLPYGSETVRVRAFDYEEDVVGRHDSYLWGNAAVCFATRVADSFAKYRWCPNIIGPTTGGTVEDLPIHCYAAMGRIQAKIPTEVVVTERREWELATAGFMALTYRPETNNACFFSANSVQRPKTFGQGDDGRKAALNHKLGTQLPYLFIICRLAHYIKVMQREHIGSWKERVDLERELQRWLNNFVSDMAVVSASVRARRPLRQAKVQVLEVDGNAGWYRIDLQVRPHFRFLGAVFELGLVGRLDKD